MKNRILPFMAGLLVAGLFAFSAAEYQVRKNTAEVDQKQGIYIFHRARPVGEFDVLGSVGQSALAMSSKYESAEETMISRAKKKYPKADGIIIDEKGVSRLTQSSLNSVLPSQKKPVSWLERVFLWPKPIPL